MRILLLLPLAAAIITSCNKNKDETSKPIANNQALAWMKTYGGSNKDHANAIVQLSTGEYVMAGSTRSTDGDLSGTRYVFDTWLVKMDQNGNKLWSSTFATNGDKYTTGLTQTSDGGFIIVGYSGYLLGYNGLEIDTFPNYAFIVKTNASGSKIWDKYFTVDSKALGVTSTSDGNTIVTGYTSVAGGYDAWVLKLDNNGNQIWNKTFGGSREDRFSSVYKTTDGGCILAGYSNSSEVAANRGDYDGWLVKLDANGNQSWSKSFGGSDKDMLKSVVQASDGGYVAVGHSNSVNGDIPGVHGGYDEWIIRTDAAGNKVWSKTFGGRNNDIMTSIVNAPDGGFVTLGYTNSIDYDVNRLSTNWGAWLIKVDRNGNKTAASTYGDDYGNGTDKMISTRDGGYIFAGYTDNRTNGASSLNYDAWIVKIDSI